MIYKCPNCDASLEYHPSLNKLECQSCGSTFEVHEVDSDAELYKENVKEMTEMPNHNFDVIKTESSSLKDDKMMKCNVYACTACGAELAVNGVEASTFCAYCGQPTIVFSRVSNQLKPEYIIPFKIEKEQAEEAIRKKLEKGFFVPRKIRNLEVERIRGIYIPFWLFDVYYHDNQYLKGTVGSGKHRRTAYFIREAEANFEKITVDASEQLSDESSQRLEPYDISGMVPFDMGYMTGFYSDRYDVTENAASSVAASRAQELYDSEVIRTVRASNVSVIVSNPECNILKTQYVMLPAWFMTFRYEDEPYTILVNGQTGKVIGAVPFQKVKVISLTALFGIVLSFLSYPLLNILMRILLEDGEGGKFLLGILIISIAMLGAGIRSFVKVAASIKLTKAKAMMRFVKDRQEDV